MRIEQLQHLLAIAKWQSMSQAAQQLYLNPSTLSTSVKNLEDELGFSIFARTPQGVSVTILGQEVLDFAERTCRDFDKLKRLAHAQTDVVGSITVLAVPAVCNTVMLHIMTAFKKRYPRINLHVDERYPALVLKGMEKGAAQIGIANCLASQQKKLASFADKHHLRLIELGQDYLRGYVSVDSPLAKRSAVTLAELKSYPLAYYHEYLTNNTIPELSDFDNIFGVSDRESIKKVVINNDAIAIFPALMELGDPYIGRGAIVPIDITDLNYTLYYYLLYSDAIEKAPVEQDLIQIISSLFAELTGR